MTFMLSLPSPGFGARPCPPVRVRSGIPECAAAFIVSPEYTSEFPWDPNSPVPRPNSLPKCYPMMAAMSAALLRAMAPALAEGFIQHTAAATGYPHDTGLGILIWASGASENGALNVGFGGHYQRCFVEERRAPPAAPAAHAAAAESGGEGPAGVVTLRDRDPRNPCAWGHVAMGHTAVVSAQQALLTFQAFGREPELGRMGLYENISRGVGAAMPHAPCPGSARPETGVGPYDVLRMVEGRSPGFREYLDGCLGLNASAFRIAARFHEGRIPVPPPRPPRPPPKPPPAPPPSPAAAGGGRHRRRRKG